MTSTSRTARCGPACRVVWEGPAARAAAPIPILKLAAPCPSGAHNVSAASCAAPARTTPAREVGPPGRPQQPSPPPRHHLTRPATRAPPQPHRAINHSSPGYASRSTSVLRANGPHRRPSDKAARNPGRSLIRVPASAVTPCANSASGTQPAPGPISAKRCAPGVACRIDASVPLSSTVLVHSTWSQSGQRSGVGHHAPAIVFADQVGAQLQHGQPGAGGDQQRDQRREVADHADVHAGVCVDACECAWRVVRQPADTCVEGLRQCIERCHRQRPRARCHAPQSARQRVGRRAGQPAQAADSAYRFFDACEPQVAHADGAVVELERAELGLFARAQMCRGQVQCADARTVQRDGDPRCRRDQVRVDRGLRRCDPGADRHVRPARAAAPSRSAGSPASTVKASTA
jgi:hypothetical protein